MQPRAQQLLPWLRRLHSTCRSPTRRWVHYKVSYAGAKQYEVQIVIVGRLHWIPGLPTAGCCGRTTSAAFEHQALAAPLVGTACTWPACCSATVTTVQHTYNSARTACMFQTWGCVPAGLQKACQAGHCRAAARVQPAALSRASTCCTCCCYCY